MLETKYNGAHQKVPFSFKKGSNKILVGIELPLVEELFFIKKDGTVSKNFEKFTSGRHFPEYLLEKVAREVFNLFEGLEHGGGESMLELPSSVVIKLELIDDRKGSFVVRLMKRVFFINSSYGELTFKFSSCDKISRF